jgi:ATP-binding cassette subfamily C protein CydD
MGGYFLGSSQSLTTLYLFRQLKRPGKKKSGRNFRNAGSRVFAVLKIAFLSGAVIDFFSAVIIACVAVYIGLSIHYIDFGNLSVAFTLNKA